MEFHRLRRANIQSLGRTMGAIACVTILSGCASSSWPQWGGPTRNFVSDSKGLSTDWGEEGPRRVWQRELGEGYSEIALDNGRLYTTYRKGDEEIVVALNAKTGHTIWEQSNAAPLIEGISESYGVGPAATPVVTGDRVCTLGRMGFLQCLDSETGDMIWSHNLVSDFDAEVPEFGFASSPVEYGGNLVVLVGGEGTGVMAFGLHDGTVMWKQHNFENIYASPLPIRVSGQDQLVALVSDEVVGLDPSSGDLLWRHPHVNQWMTSVCTPVWDGKDTLFVSSGGEAGARGLRLTRSGGKTHVEEIWSTKKLAVGGHANAVLAGGYVYATAGSASVLVSVNIYTGEIVWRKRGFPGSTLVYADGKLIVLDQDGKLTFATPGADDLAVDAEVQILEKPSWTAPTVVGTRVYLRDKKTIMALDLG